MNEYVLDASVAAKWFLSPAHESLTVEAVSILAEFVEGRCHLIVPDLFWSEFGSILSKAIRLGRLRRNSAEEALKRMANLRIPSSAANQLMDTALAIAVGFNRSFYDCVYVALAVTLNRDLLTADEKLANALAAHFPVRWLGAI